MEKISYLLAVLAVFIAAVAQIMLKRSANQEHSSFLRKFLNTRVIISYGFMLVSLTLNTVALKHMDLALLPSITSTSFLWILLLSVLCLKEKPSKNNIIGTCIIMVGVIVSGIK